MIEIAYLAAGAVVGGGVAQALVHRAGERVRVAMGERHRRELDAVKRAADEARRTADEALASARDDTSILRAIVPDAGRPSHLRAVGRATPSELTRIVERLRGYATIDGVVIAGVDGLPRTRVLSPLDESLATLSPLLTSLAPAIALDLETADARYVSLRLLPRWTGTTWLCAAAISRPPSASALDAAVAFATFQREPASPQTFPPLLDGGESTIEGGGEGAPALASVAKSRAVLLELEHAHAQNGLGALALMRDDELVVGTARALSSFDRVRPVAARLAELRRAVARRMRTQDVLRLDLHLPSGEVMTLAPLSLASRFAALLITRGGKVETAAVARLAGRLRRIAASEPTVHLERTA